MSFSQCGLHAPLGISYFRLLGSRGWCPRSVRWIGWLSCRIVLSVGSVGCRVGLSCWVEKESVVFFGDPSPRSTSCRSLPSRTLPARRYGWDRWDTPPRLPLTVCMRPIALWGALGGVDGDTLCVRPTVLPHGNRCSGLPRSVEPSQRSMFRYLPPINLLQVASVTDASGSQARRDRWDTPLGYPSQCMRPIALWRALGSVDGDTLCVRPTVLPRGNRYSGLPRSVNLPSGCAVFLAPLKTPPRPVVPLVPLSVDS